HLDIACRPRVLDDTLYIDHQPADGLGCLELREQALADRERLARVLPLLALSALQSDHGQLRLHALRQLVQLLALLFLDPDAGEDRPLGEGVRRQTARPLDD